MKYLSFLLLLTSLIYHSSLLAQEEGRFTGAITAGLTLSQIDGDAVAGYKKFGATVGGRGGVRFTPRTELNVEINYTQRGSIYRSEFPQNTLHYNLHYIDVPVEFYYKDWLVRDKNNREYAKAMIGAGLVYSRLMSYKIVKGGIEDTAAELKNNDFMFVASANFFFTRNIGMSIRWSRSLISINTDKNGGLISHLIALRAIYQF